MQIDMRRFHAAFFDEAVEHLTTMEELLLHLERTPDDRESLHSIFRAAHSIKGASGTFGFADVAQFTHGLESLLDPMREGRIATTPELIRLLLRSADMLTVLISAAKDGGEAPPDMEQLLGSLEEARGVGETAGGVPLASASPAASASVAVKHYAVTFVPGRELLRHGMEPLLLLRDLARLGEITEVVADVSQLPTLDRLVPDECYLGWTIRLKTDRSPDEIRGVFLFVEDDSRVVVEEEAVENATPSEASSAGVAVGATPTDAPASRPAASRSASPCVSKGKSLECSSIRVSVEKVDELINLVGELVIAQSMVHQAFEQLQSSTLPTVQEALTTMARSTRNLQERVMAVRMVPLTNVFRRFPRLVHDLAGNLSKEIRVELTGEETELDKQMIEQIGDPLTHLVRNSVDHGVETPEEREAAGKSREGKIGLHAYHEGGNVVIEVRDDGRGLDVAKIRKKAIQRGLIGPDDQFGDDHLHSLIFSPGFSTAEQVTDVSGRGVGMDVVKRNIEALNGTIGIESTAGQGTIFRLRLPLTLAILDGLGVSLSGDIFILPLLAVVESFRPKPGDVKTVNGRAEMLLVRGKPVPLLRLHRLFNTPALVADPTRGLVVIVEDQGRRLGLLVEDLIGQMQVVMKSLEANYRKVEGVSGATILGDGQVAFILDIAGLNRLARRSSPESIGYARSLESTEEEQAFAEAFNPREQECNNG